MGVKHPILGSLDGIVRIVTIYPLSVVDPIAPLTYRSSTFGWVDPSEQQPENS